MALLLGSSASPPVSDDPRIPMIQRMHAAARDGFMTIALLSGVNALLEFFDAKIRFIFGLGITQLVDAIAHGMRAERNDHRWWLLMASLS